MCEQALIQRVFHRSGSFLVLLLWMWSYSISVSPWEEHPAFLANGRVFPCGGISDKGQSATHLH